MPLPPPLIVPAARLHDLEDGASLEWLETDGRGGYASGTAVGANTRRYHGILVVARRPPTDRIVLLSRFEETILTDEGEQFALGVNYYPGVVHPTGHRYLEEFRLDPWPVWRYRLGRLTLTRTLFFARAADAVVVGYRVQGGEVELHLRPLVAGRDFHAVVSENDVVSRMAEVEPGRVVYRPYPDVPELVLSHDGGDWNADGLWYYRTVYPRETERGLEDREDLFSPGWLRVRLEPDRSWRVACATVPVPVARAESWAEAELGRRSRRADEGRNTAGAASPFAEFGARLGVAADAFLVERDGNLSILAGYPWFADWGRDAMISLPGLLLAPGRLEEAAAVLRTFATHVRDGLIPNRFPDHGGPVPDDHYNAADAALWFVEAVAALADAGGDPREYWSAVVAILDAYAAGTRYGIRVCDDGLLRQGEPDVQLTWMDAKVNGWVVTPREGRTVEINALWYNANLRAAGLARTIGVDAARFEARAQAAGQAFDAFWYAERGYLYDRIADDGRPDATLRPNQLFALSLPHSPVDPARARMALDAVRRVLLVPLGVRTLAPSDPGYIGRYTGPQWKRDASYHSGTAWPWLIGSFATAWLRAHGGTPEATAWVRALLEPFSAHLTEYGLGQVAEIVEGDPPHRPVGCTAQAWSVAELLRVLAALRLGGNGRI